ncbi:MAG TPA: DUF1328 domain-containing protein [Gammaproteobacteria bacterium]|nr:DUF1328 domain-containing protein [Gammaproteobacteria bacterium]
MLKWAIFFFLISLVAGFFGFTDIAAGAKKISKILFFIFIGITVVVLISAVMLGKLLF